MRRDAEDVAFMLYLAALVGLVVGYSIAMLGW